MSIASIHIIEERILSATEGSKIALFKAKKDGEKAINAVFQNTVETMAKIKRKDKKYIGSYWGRVGSSVAYNDMKKYLIG